MYKRVSAFLCAVILAVSLYGCGDRGEKPSDETTGASAQQTNAANPTEGAAPATPTANPDSFDYTEKNLDADALFAGSKVQGRTTVISYKMPKASEKTNAIALDYSASAIEFNAYCEGAVTLSLYTEPTAIGGNNLYLNVYVDGVLQGEKRRDFRFSGKKVHAVTLAENLSKGFHTFLIERQTEAERGLMYINSVTICGELTEKPANSDLFIEFIGDSITTGYGNLYPDLTGGEKDSNQASNVYQDGTKTYAYLTAKALNADYSIVAQQGIGVSSGYYPHTMLKTYTNTCYQCGRRSDWNFERKADAVIINLGTNDWTMVSNGTTTAEKIEQGFSDFCRLVRGKKSRMQKYFGYMA